MGGGCNSQLIETGKEAGGGGVKGGLEKEEKIRKKNQRGWSLKERGRNKLSE